MNDDQNKIKIYFKSPESLNLFKFLLKKQIEKDEFNLKNNIQYIWNNISLFITYYDITGSKNFPDNFERNFPITSKEYISNNKNMIKKIIAMTKYSILIDEIFLFLLNEKYNRNYKYEFIHCGIYDEDEFYLTIKKINNDCKHITMAMVKKYCQECKDALKNNWDDELKKIQDQENKNV